MKKLLILILLFFAAGYSVEAASRITAQVIVTNTPADGNNLTVNASARTWKNTVATPATQILIGSGIGANATNMFNHIATYPFAGPIVLVRSGTNAVFLIGSVDQAMTVTSSGTWASIVYTTQTVTTAYAVRVPLATEPTATARTNISSLLVTDLNTYPSNTFSATAPVFTFFANTTQAQSIGGNKTFTGVNSHTGSSWTGGTITNTTLKTLILNNDNANANGIYGFNSSAVRKTAIAPDASGIPTLYDVTASIIPSSEYGTFTPSQGNLLTRAGADTRYPTLTGANTFTALNRFSAAISNSTIVLSTFTNGTLYATNGFLDSLKFFNPSTTNLINSGNAIESMAGADDTTFQAGNGAGVLGTGAIAIGKTALAGVVNYSSPGAIAIGRLAYATNSSSIALGLQAIATNISSVAIGPGAQTHDDNTIALHNAMAYTAYFPGRFGHLRFPQYAVNNFYALGLTNSVADSSGADPTNAAFLWTSGGFGLRYRTSATSEGAGANNHLHNRYTQTLPPGGSDYSLTGSYADVSFGSGNPWVTNPTIGNYLVIADVAVNADAALGNDTINIRLQWNGVTISGSERTITNIAANRRDHVTISIAHDATAAGNSYKVQAQNATSARGSIDSDQTKITIVRLY